MKDKNRDIQNANLIHVKKGQVLNPNGRTTGSKNRKKFFSELLSVRVVGTDLNEGLVELTALDHIGIAVVKKAMDGDLPAAKEILDSIFGKDNEKVEFTHSLIIDMSKWK